MFLNQFQFPCSKDKTTTVVVLMERSSEYNDPPEFSAVLFHLLTESINQAVNLTLSWTVT